MAKLFDTSKTTVLQYDVLDSKGAVTQVKIPTLFQPMDPTANFDVGKVDEILGLKSAQIKNAIANLARRDYNAYAQYKEAQFNNMGIAVNAAFMAAASRWKGLGYTDEVALEKAAKSARVLYKELLEWYNEMFSLTDKLFFDERS